ncbi:hypothetical protein [Vibrio splendidus]|uniref:hypothetical protein n=1 Tax=Vibrio splendidus TaxID=29497 RepID=UPI003D1404D3
MRVKLAITPLILGVFGCNEENLAEDSALTINPIAKPPFRAIFEGSEDSNSYAVFDSNVRFITEQGILEKEYSKDDRKITVYMANSSLVQGLNAEFILKGDKLVCTSCALFNLDSNWARTYKHDAYYQYY